MGCGCGKSKSSNSVAQARTTVYQVVLPNGTIHSEHENSAMARQVANASGGRVRVTSKVASSA